MSPKDHRHPEWEEQWRETMAEHQSAPATEADWSAMSALLDGGGAAPPDPTPAPGVGGGVSWSFLKWLVPVIVISSLATAFWYSTEVSKQEAAEALSSNIREELTIEETDVEVGAKIISSSEANSSGREEAGLRSEIAGFAAGQSRREVGKDLASRVRANVPDSSPENPADVVQPSRAPNEVLSGMVTSEEKDPSTEKEGADAGTAKMGEATEEMDAETSETASRRPFRRIPRRMPALPREYDTEKIWQEKIERQIASLKVKPKRLPKAENGLYPRVRVRY